MACTGFMLFVSVALFCFGLWRIRTPQKFREAYERDCERNRKLAGFGLRVLSGYMAKR